VQAIEEVLPNLPMEPIAHCPEFMRGVVFVRGHLIPVIDGRCRLGVGDGLRAADPHIVCLRHGDRLVGLEVDEALNLIAFPASAVTGAAALGARNGLVSGVIERDGRLIRLVDPPRLVAEA
jgi:purine-binding chemotaxis protein CheW